MEKTVLISLPLEELQSMIIDSVQVAFKYSPSKDNEAKLIAIKRQLDRIETMLTELKENRKD